MPHRRTPLKTEEPPWPAARRHGEGDEHREDSTGRATRNRAVATTPRERKSTRPERREALLEAMGVPAPWRKLGDVLADVREAA